MVVPCWEHEELGRLDGYIRSSTIESRFYQVSLVPYASVDIVARLRWEIFELGSCLVNDWLKLVVGHFFIFERSTRLIDKFIDSMSK